MLIKKKNTSYGYTARIRYDVKTPRIHVIEKNSTLKITGEADITIISGKINIKRIIKNKEITEKLENKEKYRIPENTTITITAQTTTTLLEDGITANQIEEYLNLTVTEDEPSAEDLKYITE